MDNYCTKCGNKLEPGQKVCARCGNRVNGTVLNDFADKIKAYDYKSKAGELKVKANETIDKVKSYDYKAASENIRNGGIKSFWYKHKNLPIYIMCFIVVICILLYCGDAINETNTYSDSTSKKSEMSTENTETSSRRELEKEAISIYEDINGIGSAERDGYSAAIKKLSDAELRMILSE